MIPVIALIGRPNVGKSTLFNGLTRTRDALVADMPGLTRDRQYGTGRIGPIPYIVIDTGGLTGSVEAIGEQVDNQVAQAVEEADLLLFLVDGKTGLTSHDEEIASHLRCLGKPLQLVINKSEGQSLAEIAADFHGLGLGHPWAISAAHRQGLKTLMTQVLQDFPEPDHDPEDDRDRIRLTVVGRPNVGKSTLINRLLGEQRLLAMDQPGTTRDSIAVPLDTDRHRFMLVDTAGVRRRGKVHETIEKFSVVKTLQAIEQADVVLMMLDARQGIVDQDASLLGSVLDSGRGLVIAINKWDRLEESVRRQVKAELKRKLGFVDFAKIHTISALHGSGIVDLLPSAAAAYRSSRAKFPTPQLTRILQDAMAEHAPPAVGGRRIKLRYAHQGGQNPPRIIIHGSRTSRLPGAYKRYLSNLYRKVLKLTGTPVRIEFRDGENPYSGKGGKK